MVLFKTVPPYPPFEYGSSVRVKVTPNPHGLAQGSVYGFRKIDDLETAKKRAVPVGMLYVLVEDNSGAAFEIPAEDLELL
ncbi:MAG: hypothetical protein ABIL01_08255 [Pseudomonadota bacterium]